MSGPTLGDWVVIKSRDVWPSVISKGVAIIANDIENEADAYLIAAAPELLAELEEARIDLLLVRNSARDAAKTDPRWEGVAEILDKRVQAADAAINKATGKDVACD
jgi:hypothetical protein